MSGIEVLSRTQRIIVDSPSSVRIVNAGPMGPAGPQGIPGVGIAVGGATGNVAIAINPWTMIHDLGFKPAGWKFYSGQDCTGDRMEPDDVTDITDSVSTALWLGPVPGSWQAS